MKKIALVAVIILAVFFGVTGVVRSAENREAAEACMQRENSEKEFVGEVRMLLTEQGYDNCGINLSRVGDTEQGWEYTVRIHHHKLVENEERCKQLKHEIIMLSDLNAREGLTVEFF